eukprot:scaffold78027_cov42-Phaeocystis_antarctica.AAC.2
MARAIALEVVGLEALEGIDPVMPRPRLLPIPVPVPVPVPAAARLLRLLIGQRQQHGQQQHHRAVPVGRDGHPLIRQQRLRMVCTWYAHDMHMKWTRHGEAARLYLHGVVRVTVRVSEAAAPARRGCAARPRTWVAMRPRPRPRPPAERAAHAAPPRAPHAAPLSALRKRLLAFKWLSRSTPAPPAAVWVVWLARPAASASALVGSVEGGGEAAAAAAE